MPPQILKKKVLGALVEHSNLKEKGFSPKGYSFPYPGFCFVCFPGFGVVLRVFIGGLCQKPLKEIPPRDLELQWVHLKNRPFIGMARKYFLNKVWNNFYPINFPQKEVLIKDLM